MPHETWPLDRNAAPAVRRAFVYTGTSPGKPDGTATCPSSWPLGCASGVCSGVPTGLALDEAVVPPEPPHALTTTKRAAAKETLIEEPSRGAPSALAAWSLRSPARRGGKRPR